MHHRHKDPRYRRGERRDFGEENRGEPYYDEPRRGRFGEPLDRGDDDPGRGAMYGSGEPRYAQGDDRPLREGDWGNPEYGSFGHYGEYRGGGRWTASPDLPRYLRPGGPMAGTDVSRDRGAYYYGPEYENRDDARRLRDDDRYDPYGRDLGANWVRRPDAARRYPGYAEAQGHGAHGVESYRGLGPKGYVRSDARILEDVCERLADDPRVDARDVVVAAKNGVVTLDGTVPRRWMKHCAEDV
ncbi:MAG TPA: BON domain-containing protein, partial [Tahibacter sp.]|nr:BON domain-containing protein [Tahibacter sp.]